MVRSAEPDTLLQADPVVSPRQSKFITEARGSEAPELAGTPGPPRHGLRARVSICILGRTGSDTSVMAEGLAAFRNSLVLAVTR